MMDSLLLCLGSTLAALVGLLVLGWGARREQHRYVWVLIAAVFLIGAGFGAAETIYQVAAESGEEGGITGTPISGVTVQASPQPDPTEELLGLPAATITPPATQTARPASTAQPTAELLPSPTSRPPSEPDAPSSAASEGVEALAPSLIPAERDVLNALKSAPYYVLNVDVDFDNLTVGGSADIYYTNNETDSLDAIYLRLYPNAEHYDEGETRIDAVNVDGVSAEFDFEDTEGTILRVPLPAPLAPGDQTMLQIAFNVTVPRRSDRFGYDEGVMSLGHWYPMLAVYDDEGWNLDPYVALGDAFYSDIAFYTVHLTMPEDTVVAATGVEAGRLLHRPPRATTVHLSGATRDFALALSPEYETVSTQIEDTTVMSYYLPGHAEGGQEALQVAADALEVYNARFGRYPYSELAVAETGFTVMGSPGGMEFPGVVFISSEFYKPGGLFNSELDVVVAHEVAHQWWYGVVGNNQVDEPWLDEAFATYSTIIYFQDKQDAVAAEMAYWTQMILPYQLAQMMGIDGPLQGSLLDYNDDLISYDAIVYSKGALFLERLRELLGDEEFFALLQHHYQTHKYDLLAPDDFRRSIQEVTDSAEALALYDSVVLRGEPIEGIAELEAFGGLEGMLKGELSPEELNAMMELLGPLLDGEISPEELGDLMGLLAPLLGGELSSEDLGSMMGLLESLLDGELSPDELGDLMGLLGPLLENLQP